MRVAARTFPAAAAIWLFAASAAVPSVPQASTDFVELDVAALDRTGHSVSDLRQDELAIRENGRPVDTKTFTHVRASGTADPDDGRSVVLLMDDIGVPMTGATAMRQIAAILLSPARRADEYAVVRLSRRGDEPFGDFAVARDRIDTYRGGVVPFNSRDTANAVLTAISNAARHLEGVEHRRKAIICLGLPHVCDVEEPRLGGANVLWPAWVGAISAAARANASVYCVDATGLSRMSGARGIGLVRLTGGELFSNSNDFVSAAEAIWREASDYYLLGYWAPPGRGELRSISVNVTRKDVRLRVRKLRG
jgi:VWFA-related protein